MVDDAETFDRAFVDADDLFGFLIEAQSGGASRKGAGEAREMALGGAAGGDSVGAEKGKVLYENNSVEVRAGFGGQDPYLVGPGGSTVPLDINEADKWGLIGGLAKLSDVEKEVGRLAVLKKLCDLDGAHQAVAIYDFAEADVDEDHTAALARLKSFAAGRGIGVTFKA